MSGQLIEQVAQELLRTQERLRWDDYFTPLGRWADERRARRLARELDQLLAMERLDKELGLAGGES